MKQVQIKALLVTGLVLLSQPVLAGSLTVPNTFTANTPAVAADVNGNFTATKNAVDDNDARISTNASNISSNASSISTNTSDISGILSRLSALEAMNNTNITQTTLAGTWGFVIMSNGAMNGSTYIEPRTASYFATIVLDSSGGFTSAGISGTEVADHVYVDGATPPSLIGTLTPTTTSAASFSGNIALGANHSISLTVNMGGNTVTGDGTIGLDGQVIYAKVLETTNPNDQAIHNLIIFKISN